MAVTRLLNTFESTDHAQAARQAVSCMNHLIHLLLKAGMSRTDMVKSFKTTPLVCDSRVYFGLAPFCADLMDYVEYDFDVKDILKLNKVTGFSTTIHKFTAPNGDLLYVPDLSYYLPSPHIQLFSLQAYHQLYGRLSKLDGDTVIMYLQ